MTRNRRPPADRSILEALPMAAALARQRAASDAAAGGPPSNALDWASRYRKIESKPFSLDKFKPLRALYEDQHPRIVVIKPAQRGVSEWAINQTIFALDQGARAWNSDRNGLNVAYLFPTRDALQDFSKERFSGLSDESPYLRGLFGDSEFDGVTFKQIKQSYLYLRGAWSEAALLSFSADVVVFDEYDRMDSKAISLARARMNASDIARELYVSTPTIPGRGVHGLYEQSDKQQYEQLCEHCNEWVTVDFFRDVRVDGQDYDDWKVRTQGDIARSEVWLNCPQCNMRWTLENRVSEGRWNQQEPEVTWLRGYWIPALAFPFVDLRRLAVRAVSDDPAELQELFRSDLGKPYDAQGSKVTESMLSQLSYDLPGGMLPSPYRWENATMGVDVGSRFHYRISAPGPHRKRYILAMGSVKEWRDLDRLMMRYNIRKCVIDALPELHTAKEWAERWKGRAAIAYYPRENALRGVMWKQEMGTQVLHINRTMAMDAVCANIENARERWPALIHNDPEVVEHMTAPTRITVQDRRGQDIASWVHSKPDHLFHASVYDTVAAATIAGKAAREFNPAVAPPSTLAAGYEAR